MAYILADLFDAYASVADKFAKGGWTGNAGSGTTWSSSGGRFGGAYRRLSSASPESSKAFTAASGNVIFSYDLFLESGTDAGKFLQAYNNAGAALCFEMGITAGDALQVYNAAASVVHTTAGGIISRGVWHRVEFEVQIGSGSGIVKMWIDGVLVINIATVDLDDGAGTGCDRISWMNSSSLPYQFANPIIGDTSGAAPWNAALGDKRLYALAPTSDDTTEWTPSAGANYATQDDATPGASDGDTTYVEQTAAADAIDLYGFADLPAGVVGIIAVVVDIEAKKTDAGALPGGGSFKAQIKHSVTTADSAAFTLTTAYTRHRHCFVDCPGSTGWTKAQVDAALAGPFFDVP